MLPFLTSSLLEQKERFKNMAASQNGAKFPYYFRVMSGRDIAYAVFCSSKALYPDIDYFLEAFPDMAIFVNISNDVLYQVFG